MIKASSSIALALLLISSAASATECQSSPGNDGKWWSWRIVDSERCWYQGSPSRSKDLLHWARQSPPPVVTSPPFVTDMAISPAKAHDASQRDQEQLLMRELQHRTNNLFSIVQAMARQTAKNSESFAEFEAQFGSRIQGLGHSNALLIAHDWKGVSLETLIETQLTPFVGTDTLRIETAGPEVLVPAGTVQTLGMALHELATNASKHGALSTPHGKILLSWSFDGGSQTSEFFCFEWRETGGPPVKPSTRKGFGRFVTDQMITRSLHAKVEINLAPEGLRWTLQMPASEARGAITSSFR